MLLHLSEVSMKAMFLSPMAAVLLLVGFGMFYENQEQKPTSLPPKVAEGRLTYKVEPTYPLQAKIQHISGDVIMTAVIDKKGRIAKLKVKSGNSILAEAAVDGVKQWKYIPYKVDGEPVDVETTITIRFRTY